MESCQSRKNCTAGNEIIYSTGVNFNFFDCNKAYILV